MCEANKKFRREKILKIFVLTSPKSLCLDYEHRVCITEDLVIQTVKVYELFASDENGNVYVLLLLPPRLHATSGSINYS